MWGTLIKQKAFKKLYESSSTRWFCLMTLHKQINWPGKLMNLTWIGYLSVYFPLLPATYGSSPFQQEFHLQYMSKKNYQFTSYRNLLEKKRKYKNTKFLILY